MKRERLQLEPTPAIDLAPAKMPAAATKRRNTQANGYAARPGTGPAGETCGTCHFAVKVGGGSRAYWKCEKQKLAWTHGPGSDIRLRSSACRLWKREQ